ncbi:hypothetical protein FA15DRAFT_419748 [Coprinopsis marcescibilis]|uniref:Integral membrane protein n=1 Tax=Coprinopsis marcescibilis TaxID=230819 RepID=A0A5C3KVU3_COPMA|nr:hypothetical protein FA15DRAFT_419748 [Coprinopsis marcescibilis]
MFIGYILPEVIIFYRLYAISGHSKALGIWLSIQFGVFHVGSFIAVVAFLKNTKYDISPLPSVMPCLPAKQNSARGNSIALYGVMLFSHIREPTGFFYSNIQPTVSKTKTCIPVILLLTLAVMIKKHRRTKSTLASVFYRDGFVYFLGLTVTFAANIVITGTATYNCHGMFLVPQRVIHAILAGRAILHLREQSQNELATEPGREITELYFTNHEQDTSAFSRSQRNHRSLTTADAHTVRS